MNDFDDIINDIMDAMLSCNDPILSWLSNFSSDKIPINTIQHFVRELEIEDTEAEIKKALAFCKEAGIQVY